MGRWAPAVLLLFLAGSAVAVRRLTADPEDALTGMLYEHASSDFSAKVEDFMDSTLPKPVLLDLRAQGYRLEVNSNARQGRWFKDPELDSHGGLFYPRERAIVIAEEVHVAGRSGWHRAYRWRDAVGHEVGHAVSHRLGERFPFHEYSQSPEFAAAYAADVREMPGRFFGRTLPDGRWNPLDYYLYPDPGGGRVRAGEETFAESFNVLLRGGSSEDSQAFHERFPRALEATRAAVTRVYGPVFPTQAEAQTAVR